MIKLRTAAKVFALTALFAFAAADARAQATRTWVSGTGNDADPCSRTAPCRTFAGAFSNTAINGEINVLDPGGFGGLTIDRPVTIDGLGITGGALVSGVSGITVNIPSAPSTDRVILRNLQINGLNGSCDSCHGIRVFSADEVTVENVTVQNFVNNAINVNLTETSTVNIRNVTTDNIGAAAVRAATTSGQAIVFIDDSRLRGTTGGVLAAGNARVSVRDTVIIRATTGIRTTGNNSIINVDDAFVSFCSTGVQASAGSSINVSDSIIAQNSTGVSANGGAVNSFGGNSLINNTATGAFSSTTNKQ